MKAADVVPAFLAACPSIRAAWEKHLEFWDDDPDRGHFNDAAVVAHHLVDSYGRGDVAEFPAVFAVLERCLIEGDDKAQELAVIGVLEDIQNIATHRPFGPSVFYNWLGPKSRAAWDELNTAWRRVTAAKAGAEDDSQSEGHDANLPDPSSIRDPDLRKLIEQMARKNAVPPNDPSAPGGPEKEIGGLFWLLWVLGLAAFNALMAFVVHPKTNAYNGYDVLLWAIGDAVLVALLIVNAAVLVTVRDRRRRRRLAGQEGA